MSMPDFIIAGAARSGTTSLAMYLNEHPEIFIPQKEPLFFVSDFYRNLNPTQPYYKRIKNMIVFTAEEYQALFRAESKKVTGDASTAYLYLYQMAIPNIKKYAPGAKIIIILRRPWERAFSAYTYLVQKRFENLSFEDALKMETERRHNHWEQLYFYVQAGFYYDQVKAFLENFSQVKIYLYDDFAKDPLSVVKDLYAFLGVDTAFMPDINVRYNVSGVPKNKLLNIILTRQNLPVKFRPFINFFISEQKRIKIRSWLMKKNLDRPWLPEKIKRSLQGIYYEDIVKLQALLKRDLSPWLDEN